MLFRSVPKVFAFLTLLEDELISSTTKIFTFLLTDPTTLPPFMVICFSSFLSLIPEKQMFNAKNCVPVGFVAPE